MNTLTSWFKRSRKATTAASPQANVVHQEQQGNLNQGTFVSVAQLIQLQGQARKLDLSQRSFARASTTGSHHSRFRGRGMDYQESRIYQAGDDIRNMDWRVTARSGKPHTKLYQEERERPVMLLLDFSPSMFFGSKKVLKSVQAAKIAALLAWAATLRGDRVGALIIANQQAHKELAPKSGKRGALQLIRELVKQVDPQRFFQSTNKPETSKTNARNALNDELQRLRRISRPGSLIFIISDFYQIDEDTSNHLLRLSHHNDLIAIQIIDPLELQVPPAGRYGVSDGKHHSGVLNTRSKKRRQRYNDFFSKHHQAVAALMHKRNIPLLKISTADDPSSALQKVFGTTRQRHSILSKVA